MRLWKKILIGVVVVVLGIVALFVLVVGPWPTYASTGFQNASYYKNSVSAIDRSAADSNFSPQPGALQAGWGFYPITPPVGTPLAGFGDRQGKPSTGVHDDCYVKALALSDGADTAVIVGSDMLIIPENLSEAVRKAVAAKTPLKPDDIYFNSSHTHSGPGAWGPGFAGKGIAGEYDPKIFDMLVTGFTNAIVEAHGKLEPAAIGYGSLDVPDFIRNRTRDAGVDSTLGYLVVEQDDKDRCILVRYSAHPTVLGGSNMQFTAEYPGFLQRAIETKTGHFAMYLGGALGSMGPKPPEGADGFAKASAMGEALAAKVLDALPAVTLEKNVEVASVGTPIDTPPAQVRLNTSWRLSPFAFRLLGTDTKGWIQGLRIGNLYLVGMPADFSGELSSELHDWGRDQDKELWITSFNGDYVGYISPDKYYAETEDGGGLGYETGLMSWVGPNAGAYFTDLSKHVVETLSQGSAAAS